MLDSYLPILTLVAIALAFGCGATIFSRLIGEKKPSEADALIKAELEESRRELKKLREAEEKRTKKELEDQGKFKELLASEQARNADLLAKIAAAERRNELLQTVTAHTTELNKAGLMKMAERIDAETGREKPLAEVLKLAEEEMVTIPPSLAVQGHDEEVGPFEVLQGPLPGFPLHEGIAERAAEPVQDGSPQEEVLNALGLMTQDLLDEIVQDETVAPGERSDQAGDVLLPPHGERRQLEAGDPPFGAAFQGGDVLRRRHAARERHRSALEVEALDVDDQQRRRLRLVRRTTRRRHQRHRQRHHQSTTEHDPTLPHRHCQTQPRPATQPPASSPQRHRGTEGHREAPHNPEARFK